MRKLSIKELFEEVLNTFDYRWGDVSTWGDQEVTPGQAMKVLSEVIPDYLSWFCLDCNEHTGEINEYYMVHDHLWVLNVPEYHGMMCIGCLEDRLGRKLNPEDFTDCPLNQTKDDKSQRLKNRLFGDEDEGFLW